MGQKENIVQTGGVGGLVRACGRIDGDGKKKEANYVM